MLPTTTPSPRTGQPTGHLAALDGVRSVAIMLVVGVHVAVATGMAGESGLGWQMLANGGVGVPIFFVLSGFLLYRPFARASLDGTRRPDVRRYLRRRALRVLPAYWLMLPFVLPLFNPEEARDPLVWLQMVTLTQNYDPHPPWPMTASGLEGLGPIWSLTVEAAFYVVLPLLAAGLHRFSRGEPRRLLTGLGLLGGLSLLEAVGLRYAEYLGTVFGGDPFRLLFYNEHLLPRSLVFFVLGMAMAVLAERPNRWSGFAGASPGLSWAVAGCALALMSTPLATPMNGVQSAHQYLVHNLLSVVVSAAVVAPAAFGHDGPAVRALLANPLMCRLGLVSYGVFLWHMPVIELWYDLTGRSLFLGDFWLVLGITLVFSLILAALSHLFVEQPAQRLGRRSFRPLPERAQQ
ncbi:acyltransferase family protein [Actinocorallia populi]|uniref:acyltransferase family protein n=1 Tax=Actinocorallia populi TaxID=2079200 RepID=UPI00130058A8|nr:acyltransferase [Actinocorallia populi]